VAALAAAIGAGSPSGDATDRKAGAIGTAVTNNVGCGNGGAGGPGAGASAGAVSADLANSASAIGGTGGSGSGGSGSANGGGAGGGRLQTAAGGIGQGGSGGRLTKVRTPAGVSVLQSGEFCVILLVWETSSFLTIRFLERRSSSMAEHRFRKAGVEGSTPFFGFSKLDNDLHARAARISMGSLFVDL
jgi:hypothetical protein